MIRIGMQVKGLNELMNNMGETRNMVIPLIQSTLNKSSMTIKTNAKAKAPVAFGKLKRGISHTVEGLSGIVWSKEKYGLFVELGTRPHFPPVEALKPWARLKLGNENLAWAVAKKIAKRGTKAKPFFQPAVNESLPTIRTNFGELANQLIKIMGK